jgi:hypothetical protein
MDKDTKMNIEEFVIENYFLLGNKKCTEILNVNKSVISNITTKYKLKMDDIIKRKFNSESKIKKDGDYKVNTNKFISDIDENGSYILGLLWADGYLNKDKKNNSISIECIKDDMVYFKTIFNKTGEWGYNERLRTNKKNKVVRLTTNNKYLKDYLSENDFLDKSLSSPTKILNKIPSKLTHYFLLGIIDRDGCFYYNEKRNLRQFSITGSLLQDYSVFEDIFNKLNIKYTIRRIKNSKTGYSQIRISNKSDIKKIGDFIYSDINDNKIGLPRKYDKYLKIIGK